MAQANDGLLNDELEVEFDADFSENQLEDEVQSSSSMAIYNAWTHYGPISLLWDVIPTLVLSIVYFYIPVVYVKPLPVLYLAGRAAVANTPYSRWITLGLILSAGGDVSLEFDGFAFFVLGLGLFLCGHICYIKAHYMSLHRSLVELFARFRNKILLIVFLFACYIAALMVLVLPYVDIFLVAPVVIYAFTLACMAFLACCRCLRPNRVANHHIIAAVGSLVFVSSDSSLAINMFRGHFIGSGYVVMITYYAAQTFIQASVRFWR